jgi:DnaJ-domain-containing protein 1
MVPSSLAKGFLISRIPQKDLRHHVSLAAALPLASSPPSSSPSHYALLQVPETATPAELRQAFRGLSKRFHPDTTDLPAEQAARSFQQLQQAYAVLSDPEQRRRYDAQLYPAPPSPARVSFVAPDPRPVSVRRDLSGGEWLALLLLGFALVLSLVLGVGVAWMRGAELVAWPSWWSVPADTGAITTSADAVTGLAP